MFFGGFPFGDMPEGMGGMGGMGGPREPANTTEYYETLGVEKDATAKQIKKAFMKIAAKEHPDKGGDPEKFKAASEAYEVLKDDKTRKAYDAGGKEAVERAKDGGPDMGGMFGGGRSRRRKTKDHVFPVDCNLERLAQGHTAKFAVTRDILCRTCGGSGCREGVTETECSGCDGHGIVMMVRRMGPMIQQVQQPCRECGGKGKIVADEDRCGDCHGSKTTREREVMEVHVDKGMKHGQKIKFAGKSDEHPDAEAGDLVFVIQQKDHPSFVRREADLIMVKKITLTEALTGAKFVVKHPDGRQIMVSTPKGEPIAHGSVKGVPECGMPQYGAPFSKGNLFIKFEVQFPSSLDEAASKVIASALPVSEVEDPPMGDDEAEVVHCREVDMDEERERRSQQRRAHAEAYDSDDDEGEGGRRVQCANQ